MPFQHDSTWWTWPVWLWITWPLTSDGFWFSVSLSWSSLLNSQVWIRQTLNRGVPLGFRFSDWRLSAKISLCRVMVHVVGHRPDKQVLETEKSSNSLPCLYSNNSIENHLRLLLEAAQDVAFQHFNVTPARRWRRKGKEDGGTPAAPARRDEDGSACRDDGRRSRWWWFAVCRYGWALPSGVMFAGRRKPPPCNTGVECTETQGFHVKHLSFESTAGSLIKWFI